MLGCTGRLIPQEGTQGHPMRAGRALTPATQLRWVHLTPRELRPHCQAQGAVSAPGHNKRPEKRPALGAGLLCACSPQRGPITIPIVQGRQQRHRLTQNQETGSGGQKSASPCKRRGLRGTCGWRWGPFPATTVTWTERDTIQQGLPGHHPNLRVCGSCTWCWQRLLTALWAGRTAWVCMGPRAGLPPCVACACAMRVCRARVPFVPCACVPCACGWCVCAICVCAVCMCHLCAAFPCSCVPCSSVCMCAQLVCAIHVCYGHACASRVLPYSTVGKRCQPGCTSWHLLGLPGPS